VPADFFLTCKNVLDVGDFAGLIPRQVFSDQEQIANVRPNTDAVVDGLLAALVAFAFADGAPFDLAARGRQLHTISLTALLPAAPENSTGWKDDYLT
jgi:hypothetical protein